MSSFNLISVTSSRILSIFLTKYKLLIIISNTFCMYNFQAHIIVYLIKYHCYKVVYNFYNLKHLNIFYHLYKFIFLCHLFYFLLNIIYKTINNNYIYLKFRGIEFCNFSIYHILLIF